MISLAILVIEDCMPDDLIGFACSINLWSDCFDCNWFDFDWHDFLVRDVEDLFLFMQVEIRIITMACEIVADCRLVKLTVRQLSTKPQMA